MNNEIENAEKPVVVFDNTTDKKTAVNKKTTAVRKTTRKVTAKKTEEGVGESKITKPAARKTTAPRTRKRTHTCFV